MLSPDVEGEEIRCPSFALSRWGHYPVGYILQYPFGLQWLVKYPHSTPITPSRRTKLGKDAATVRAIGMPNIA